MESRGERVAREDLVLFINACFACNGQGDFYSSAEGQAVSIRFLHEYILVNYRRLYARCLAAGINHFNQGLILVNLLANGRDVPEDFREEEGRLIAAALQALPPQRALKTLKTLRDWRVNNRRSRAVVASYLASRNDRAFDAVKYRKSLSVLCSHNHLQLPPEHGTFLFGSLKKVKAFKTPLFDAYRRARYEQSALYELPMTIAEGFAAKHGVPREEFLRNIAPRMTAGEKARLQNAAQVAAVEIPVELGHMALTKLALYVLSFPREEREARAEEFRAAMNQSAHRALRRAPLRLGRVAAILDRSWSSSGSSEKRRRPLAVALAAQFLLRAASTEFKPFWTVPTEDEVLVTPKGQTDLATPLLEALEWDPEVVVFVSDGFENSPTSGANEVLRVFRKQLDPDRKVSAVHLNPVFDSERYAPRALGNVLPTVGLRDAEDLLTMLGFARFADGSAPLSELETYLEGRIRVLFERATRPRKLA